MISLKKIILKSRKPELGSKLCDTYLKLFFVDNVLTLLLALN